MRLQGKLSLWLIIFYASVTFAAIKLPYPTKSIHTPPRHAVSLSLREAIMLALRYNSDVQNAEIDRAMDKFNLELSYYNFEPQYSLNGTATYGDGTKPNYTLTPAVSLNTPVGTKLSATLNNQLVGNEGPSVGLSITQPLLRGFGIDVNSADLQNAIDQEMIGHLTLKNTVMETVVSVINAYLQLAQDYNSVDIQKLQLEQSQKTYGEYQVQIKAGKQPPGELIQQAANIAQEKYALQDQLNSTQQDYHNLLNLLGLKLQALIKIDRNVGIDKRKTPDFNKSYNLALDNNVEYRQALLSLKQDHRNVIVAQDQQRWQLDLDANATVVNKRLIGGIGPDITGRPVASRSMDLKLNIPIHDLENRKQLIEAKIALQQQEVNTANQKRQVGINISEAIRNLDSLKQQIDEANLSAKLAERSYQIENIKWHHGRASNIDLNTQLQNLTVAKSQVVSAKIQYLESWAQFQKLTGVLLDSWNIKLREQTGIEQ